jgi:hypothetical protein
MLYNIYSFNLKLTIDLLNEYNNQKSTILDIVEFKYNNYVYHAGIIILDL